MSDSELVPKIGTKSVVWEYFGLERGVEGRPIDDGSVVCRSCRRRVLARNGNTSNLLAYLKANHAKIHSEVKAAMSNKVKTSVQKTTPTPVNSQPTLVESITKSQRYERRGKKWKELTDAVTYFVAKDCLPIYTVEKPGFKRLLSLLMGGTKYQVGLTSRERRCQLCMHQPGSK